MPQNPEDIWTKLSKATQDARDEATQLRGLIKDARQAKKEMIEFLKEVTGELIVTTINHLLKEKMNVVDRVFSEKIEHLTRHMNSEVGKVTGEMNDYAKLLSDGLERVRISDKAMQTFVDLQRDTNDTFGVAANRMGVIVSAMQDAMDEHSIDYMKYIKKGNNGDS